MVHENNEAVLRKTPLFAGLARLTKGCPLRVSCEVIAYQDHAAWGSTVLPISAFCELAGVTVYAINILGTFVLEPVHEQKQPLVVGIN